MEGNTFNMEAYKKDLDEVMETVMPESWIGHARLFITEQDDLTPKQRDFAIRLTEKVLDGKRGASSKKVAELAIKKATEVV